MTMQNSQGDQQERKWTFTEFKSPNPVRNEALDFIIFDPDHMEYEELEVEKLNDKHLGLPVAPSRLALLSASAAKSITILA
ncbi:hypothetical protein ACFX1Z_020210 [Malus domestica]